MNLAWIVSLACALGACCADAAPPSEEIFVSTAEQAASAAGGAPSKRDAGAWGGVQVVPYGSLWGNMVYATSRTNPGSFTLWVFSAEEQGESAFEIDARRSRFGVDVTGPDIVLGEAAFRSSGNIEIDFFGQFLTENRASARLRHAYWEAESDNERVLIGQTWDLISPLLPGSVNLSAGWAGGNIGFRRPQFRYERLVELAGPAEGLLQVALNQDIVDDFPTEPGIRRETASFPVLMVRTAVAYPNADGQAATAGLSGHYGQTGFDFLTAGPPPLDLPPQDDARFDTWSVNVDFETPLSDRHTLRGEFFHGANLSPFLGGIGQGVCPCARKSIHSTGGWLEWVYRPSPFEESHWALGVDDPANGDFLVGRSLNQFAFGNYIVKLTDELSTGLEVAWWRTAYLDKRQGQISSDQLGPLMAGEAATVEFMVRYDF